MMRTVRNVTMTMACLPALCLALCWPGAQAWADPAPFDLAGPNITVAVTRQGVTLPIASVPQLAPGDTVRVQVVLPASENAHYLLVAAFLRDPTNPPPDSWFFRSETWKAARRGGGALNLTVPAGANHLVLFMAPATGGDFATLRKAVQARPGAFVRAAQDLEQASLDRSRFETYLATIRRVAAKAPDTLVHDAPVIAGSLRIKINDECLQRQAEFQAACLLDSKQSVVLGGDGAANTSTLTGAAADLLLNLSATPQGGAGYYSPYIGAIRDIVGIFGAMRTARYQYIPALGLARGGNLALVLNTPPSFADPKSVLMVALPEVKPAMALVPHREPGAVAACLGAKQPIVPVTISPLYYATDFAHDLTLRVHLAGDAAADLPVVPDPVRGGLVIAPGATLPADSTGPMSATLHGMWGFEPFTGPDVALAVPGAWHWQRKDAGKTTSKDDGPLTLTGAASACIVSVTATAPHGTPQPASWKPVGPDEITIVLPAKEDRHDQIAISIEGPKGTAPATLMVAPPAKAPPPAARIIARVSEPPTPESANAPTFQLGNTDEIPANARLSFTLKAEPGDKFAGRDAVEVGTTGNDTVAHLTVGSGLTLVDPTILVVSLTPAQALGSSAYGPLRVRLMRGDVAGDWLGVGTMVRLPTLKALDCKTGTAGKCTLRGDALYLLASVSATRGFDSATSVADGYPGTTLAVPRPLADAKPGPDSTLFVRLHDAPEVINQVTFHAADSAN
ncbi:hypothetical protein [Novosphingobium sp.]|uniref:hypothetical protein n=1 Tax=Novosphingobium sp. TaxID=1874826 RepID=UPI003B52F915